MSSQPRAADRIAPFPRRRLAILPPTHADPQPVPGFEGIPGPSQATPGVDRSRPAILERAEALGIPWERILGDEIRAERALRRYIADLDAFPLVAPLVVLSFSFLQSWRVRDRVQSLAGEARGISARKAVRQLRAVFQRLAGRAPREREAFAEHLWFAYQRVLLLQRACHAAARSRGSLPERAAFVCERTRCGYDDAAWALCHEGSRRNGHRLDAAIRKARDEGFQIPRADTEARAFAQLRAILRTSGRLDRRRAGGRPPSSSAAVPARVALAADAF
ncbi:MAG TPA: hypothetical protein VH854_05375 [Thermoanaerobaculia bacterium]|jgi:hypothetical protein|nr:hypothetical protein [Thermoanaerobaculia bacterium]